MDNQNIDDGIGIAAHSLSRAAPVGGSGLQGPPWCQLYRLLRHLLILLFMASTSWSKGQHLHSRKQEEKKRRETEREVPNECIIFLFISHCQELSYMVIPSCKGLGNVVLTLTAVPS